MSVCVCSEQTDTYRRPELQEMESRRIQKIGMDVCIHTITRSFKELHTPLTRMVRWGVHIILNIRISSAGSARQAVRNFRVSKHVAIKANLASHIAFQGCRNL